MNKIHVLNPYTTLGGGSISQNGLNKILFSTKSFSEICMYNLSNKKESLKLIYNLISIVNKNNDFILIQGLFELEYILFDLFLNKKKNLIIIPRGAFVPDKISSKIINKPITKWLLWKLFIKNRVNSCASWVPTSLLEQNRLLNVGANKNNAFIIPDYFNGIERFSEISDYHLDRYLRNKNYFLYVGRISIEKNISFLIDLFYAFNQKDNLFQLIILAPYSKDKYYKLVEKKILSLNLQNKIIIKTNTKQSELISYYKYSKLLLLPSHIESLGFIVLESIYFYKYIVISENVPFNLNDTNLGANLKLDIKLWVDNILDYINKDKDLFNPKYRDELLMKFDFIHIRNSWYSLFKIINKPQLD
jgi:glycosyltransferase involved in cell wall biosynthesis